MSRAASTGARRRAMRFLPRSGAAAQKPGLFSRSRLFLLVVGVLSASCTLGSGSTPRSQAVTPSATPSGSAETARREPADSIAATAPSAALDPAAQAKPAEAPPAGVRGSPDPDSDRTIFRVPVGSSPTRGPPDALVTVIVFSDFQCPYCQKAALTIDELLRRHPADIRFVFKHQPLPFHERALPAARFAVEARAQKGDQGFWQAHDELFRSSPKLANENLLAIATALKLNLGRVRQALAAKQPPPAVDSDVDLADDVHASGTPHFFINGRRFTGAQPLEEFEKVVGEELVKARALLKNGTPQARLYDTIMQDAVGPQPPETKAIPAPGKESPSRGPASAPVVIQIWSDFECPFCRRVNPTIHELEQEFPRQIRIAWRNLPLPFHPNARAAAAAALEAHEQRGARGFWQMHDLLFGLSAKPAQKARASGEAPETPALDRLALEGYAKKLGLDLNRFKKALDDATHEPAITRDVALATANGIRGTPAFVINGYFVSGAQPLAAFRKVVRRALADHKSKPSGSRS